MHLKARASLCLILSVALVGGVAATPVASSASARGLSKKRAAKAAYRLARKVGKREGAVYAIAGFCKRRSARRVECWAGIVFSNYYGAAQRVRVTLRHGKTHARRHGKVYKGYVGRQEQGESGGEWAVCGIHQSVCVGS
jgi:hypothetical protein